MSGPEGIDAHRHVATAFDRVLRRFIDRLDCSPASPLPVG